MNPFTNNYTVEEEEIEIIKQAHEQVFTSFESTADRLNSVPDVELNEEEKSEKEALIKEMGLGCLSGMLLCLDRTQRLVYIIGHMFGADHNIGSEIMEMSKTNFRMKLSREREKTCIASCPASVG